MPNFAPYLQWGRFKVPSDTTVTIPVLVVGDDVVGADDVGEMVGYPVGENDGGPVPDRKHSAVIWASFEYPPRTTVSTVHR